jgi:cobalt/nickel transport system permease protein
VHGNFLDRYIQGDSLIHRLDPRLKLVATLAFVVVATSARPRAWPAFVLLSLLALGAVLLSRIPLGVALRRSAIALPFAGMVALSLPFTRGGEVLWSWQPLGLSLAVTEEGLILFGAVLVKSWLSVLFAGLLIATTPFTQVIKAARALRLPAILASTVSFMYRYLFVLVDEAGRLMTARAARSVGSGRTVWWRARVLGGMVGSLFIRSYERSERIYAAMLSRGYAGELRSMAVLTWQRRDTWIGLLWAALLAGAAAAGWFLL